MIKKDFVQSSDIDHNIIINLDQDISGQTLLFVLKDSPVSTDNIISKAIEDIEIISESDGIIKITILKEETLLLDGPYFYNLILNDIVSAYGSIIYTKNGEIGYDLYKGNAVECRTACSGNKLFILIDEEIIDNNEYTLVLKNSIEDIDGNLLNEEILYQINSKYDPLGADPANVYAELLSLVGEDIFSTSDIASQIRGITYAISKLTKRKDIDWEDPPFEAREYIKNKTMYDLVLSKMINTASGVGEKIDLGPMTVDTKGVKGVLTEILAKLGEQLQPWYDLTMGLSNRGMATLTSTARKGTYEGSYQGEPRRWE